MERKMQEIKFAGNLICIKCLHEVCKILGSAKYQIHSFFIHVALESYGDGYMVAFAGLKYAARSTPVFVGNSTHVVTSFTLVLEFEKGRLNNLFWKKYGCASCKGNSNFVCLNDEDCGMGIRNCTRYGGKVDCSPGIQLAFSGTDKHYQVLNSWYEVSKLRQYSLFNLYSDLKDSITNIF